MRIACVLVNVPCAPYCYLTAMISRLTSSEFPAIAPRPTHSPTHCQRRAQGCRRPPWLPPQVLQVLQVLQAHCPATTQGPPAPAAPSPPAPSLPPPTPRSPPRPEAKAAPRCCGPSLSAPPPRRRRPRLPPPPGMHTEASRRQPLMRPGFLRHHALGPAPVCACEWGYDSMSRMRQHALSGDMTPCLV